MLLRYYNYYVYFRIFECLSVPLSLSYRSTVFILRLDSTQKAIRLNSATFGSTQSAICER